MIMENCLQFDSTSPQQKTISILDTQSIRLLLFGYLSSSDIINLALTHKKIAHFIFSNLFHHLQLVHQLLYSPFLAEHSPLDPQLFQRYSNSRFLTPRRHNSELAPFSCQFSNALSLVRQSFTRLTDDSQLSKNLLASVIRILKEPQVQLPRLHRNDIGRFANSPIQRFLSEQLCESLHGVATDEQCFADLQSFMSIEEVSIDQVLNQSLLKIRYEYVDHKPIPTTSPYLDSLQSLIWLISLYARGVGIVLADDRGCLSDEDWINLVLTRHRGISYSLIQLQEKLSFFFDKYNQLFEIKFPNHPSFPKFSLWRVMLKSTVSTYQKLINENVVKSLSSLWSQQLQRQIDNYKYNSSPLSQRQETQMLLDQSYEMLLDLSLNEYSVHFLQHSAQILSEPYSFFKSAIHRFQQGCLEKCQNAPLPLLLNVLSLIKMTTSKTRPCIRKGLSQELRQFMLDYLQNQIPPDLEGKFKEEGHSQFTNLIKQLSQKTGKSFPQDKGHSLEQEIIRNYSMKVKVHLVQFLKGLVEEGSQRQTDNQIYELGKSRGLSMQNEPLQEVFFSLQNKLTVSIVEKTMKSLMLEEQDQQSIQNIQQYNSDNQQQDLEQEPPCLTLKR